MSDRANPPMLEVSPAERRSAPPQDLLVDALQRLMTIQAVALGPALREAATAIAAATGAEKVDAFLHDERSATLVAVGVSDTPLGAQQRALGLDRLALANGGRVADVYRTGLEFMTGRADSDPQELPGIAGALGVRSSVIVPVDVAGARRGVLQLSSTRPDAFPEHVLPFARAVGHWVGVIAHRGEMVERLSAEAAERGRRTGAEELVTVVAHDIRNYLGPVHGRIVLLKQRATRDRLEPYRRDAESAERSCVRLARLVTDLLDVARIEQGLFELQRVPVDLATLAREVAEGLESPKVAVTVEGELDVVVDADPVRLRQALENLLSNAQKYSPPGTAIRVVTSTTHGAAGEAWGVVEIVDRGPGMTSELASRVFEKFVRSASSKGLGLGLYLAREIAHAHGGELELSTSPGRGTTVAFRVPAHRR